MAAAMEFSQDVADVILERIADGESLRRICADESLPSRSVIFKWLADPANATFVDQYARACEARAEALFEDILEIADDSRADSKFVGREGEEYEVCNTEFVQRARLRVDARKWMVGKLAPKKYGDKLTLGGEGEGGAITVVVNKPA